MLLSAKTEKIGHAFNRSLLPLELLGKARARIRELEDQRLEQQGDQQELMEKYNALTRQLQKLKEDFATKQDIDAKIFKVCFSMK